MRTIVAFVCLLADSHCLAQPPATQDTIKGKKVIEWGWDEPDTKFMRENVEKIREIVR